MKKKAFKQTVSEFYRSHRRDLPWRPARGAPRTRDPYRILVSEIMLQQTRVPRVLQKYDEFIKKFPGVHVLAAAPLHNVLQAWQGLGYNRRAIYLKKTAEILVEKYRGRFPRDPKELQKLPGIGHTTASALCAFTWQIPVTFIETNIRAVFIHHFFKKRKAVSDAEILPLIKQTLDQKNPREWYYALMDYGVHLKKLHKNPARRSAHHAKQTSFHGSDREIRGAILKLLIQENAPHHINKEKIKKHILATLDASSNRVSKNLSRLQKEGFIKSKNGKMIFAA